ncbi:ABC-ATPase domain-containing protein [Thermosulfurimonas sp.]|uniref:ABC-ATPase domain-containing protein n=1 Tax=Thermosulfurimonas sp. TaxID=2080236 RepID=UPI0025E72335|nr:ABC-ATPase domain-containing protein [Thermosulfurimonas sp.]
MDRLRRILFRLDGRGYGAYKELRGAYRFPEFTLYLDRIQSDPFAPPSRVRVRVPAEVARLPSSAYASEPRRIGLENFLADTLARRAREYSGVKGSGKSGLIVVHGPGQELLPRSTVSVFPDGQVEARFFVGLPAAGRRILAREAWKLLGEILPRLVRESLLYPHLPSASLWEFVTTYEDAHYLREKLVEMRLVAFVAEGAILPRASGVDPRPAPEAVPFEPPPELRVEIELPHRGPVRGMGIPEGITLIVGGGFHGKSTLLRALELGIYNHRPGDGRELVVSRYETVKIRAEDGRSVCGVDISPFITHLPLGKPTENFETPCASGSTSQAAAIMEALEVGARVLLLDEDTSATNFMIRDARMQALIAKEKEPITPFIDRVRELYERFGVSTVLVMGGSGDYLEVADTVIAMDHFRPRVVTAEARRIVQTYPSGRKRECPRPLDRIPRRRVLSSGLPRGEWKIKVQGTRGLILARQEIDLSAVEQLVSADQVRTIGVLFGPLLEGLRSGRTIDQAVTELEERLRKEGFSALTREVRGDLAFVRRFELAAALNRLRTLKAQPL